MAIKRSNSGHTGKLEKKYSHPYKWQWSFLYPKYWPVWGLLSMVWLLGRLPMPWFIKTGKCIGRILMHILSRRKYIAMRNLQLCFPELSLQAVKVMVRKNFEFAGIALLEPGLVWFARQKRMQKLYRIEGWKHFEAAKKQGKPVLLCGLHMQCLEVMGYILSQNIATNHLYRVNNNPLYEYISGSKRLAAATSTQTRLIPHKAIRDFLHFMQQNQTGSVIPDHDLGRKPSLFVPFFKQLTATVPVVSFYAKTTDAIVLMMDYFLDEKTNQYVFRISPPLKNFPTQDRVQDTVYINQLIEERVKEHPEQYLWMHRRFKTRPNKDDPSLYENLRQPLKSTSHR